MKYAFGFAMFFLTFAQVGLASSVVNTEDRTFAIGEDGKVYQRVNCDDTSNPYCSFRALPAEQIPGGIRPVDISVNFLATPAMARNAYILSVVGNDGLIYKSDILHDGDALTLSRDQNQLPGRIKVYTGRTTPTAVAPVTPLSPSSNRLPRFY